MVIDRLQIKINKIKYNGLLFSLLLVSGLLLYSSFFGSNMDFIQFSTILLGAIAFVIFINVKATNAITAAQIDNSVNITNLKRTAISSSRVIVHMGLLLLLIILNLFMHNKLNLAGLLGFLPLVLMNILFLFSVRNLQFSTKQIIVDNQHISVNMHETLPWPLITGANDSGPMERASNWHSDGAHPFSFTNMNSPNFPGYHFRRDL